MHDNYNFFTSFLNKQAQKYRRCIIYTQSVTKFNFCFRIEIISLKTDNKTHACMMKMMKMMKMSKMFHFQTKHSLTFLP
jgi:hypothetical protein